MRYLVTGGAGFIGSHLVDRLVERGDDVIVLDNLATGSATNLDSVADRIEFVHGSVLDAMLVDELVQRSDVVVHLAAAVGVKLVVEKPLRSLITNIRGSETILEAAHRYRAKVLLASTSEIYGKGTKVPFAEEDDRLLGSTQVARWAYSTAKAVDEILAFAYHRERGLPTIVVRLFNISGPRQTPTYGMVIPRFVEQALAGEPLTVFGDGTQSRCFCHVDDAVEGLLQLLDRDDAVGEVFNLGSAEEVSVADLAALVIELCGSKSEVQLIAYEDVYMAGFEDMARRVPDLSKIEKRLGWVPTRSLKDTVAGVIAEMS